MGHCCIAELLICLSTCSFICVTVQTVYRGEFGYKTNDYEIVFPIKVKEDGDFLSHLIPHFFKNKRHLEPTDTLHYVLSDSEKSYLIELTPNVDLLSPGMVTEIHRGDGVKRRDVQSRSTPADQCYYRGKIKGAPDTYVAVSTCTGLSGYIRTRRRTYYIEPLAKERVPSPKQPHKLYKRERDDDDAISCKTDADLAEVMAKRSVKEAGACDERNAETRSNATGDASQKNATRPHKKSRELHIEALVVLDYTMVAYHKEFNLENYVLTVFNMAHGLFHDATLGTNINLAIVRMIRLEQDETGLNTKITRNASRTLNHFRTWQREINPADDNHPNHHDIAVLLTRVDICDDVDDCGLLGTSIIGSICDPLDQAVLCEDNGLRLGYNIAHQIGHTLAIPHDTKEACGLNSTRPGAYITKVMSPSISIRITEWSLCSPKYLRLFLDSGFGKCLYDEPTDHSFELYDVLPGVMYDGDYQCREIFGPKAALCNTGIDCRNLICYIEDRGCIETHTFAAPGTFCDEKKWCYRGNCIQIGSRSKKIDGGWSDWSEWSDCSRSCGSGVSSQVRHCDNPPPSRGGKYCVGNHKHHRICSTEPCDVSRPTFRDVQCSQFNYWIYPEDNKMHIWKYYYMPEENPCVLYCKNDEGAVASLLPRVIDGTNCQRGIRDVCIDGLCKEVPCDLNLESNAVEDACGVCNGDGTSCDIIANVTDFTMKHITTNEVGKLVKILTLPLNTVNTKIEQIVPTQSVLQVRNAEGNIIYIFGESLGMHDVPGSKAWIGLIRTSQVALTIPGPVSTPLSIWLDLHDNVTIKYSYGVVPTKKRTPVFMWDYLTWTRCSAECDIGIQMALPNCIEQTAGLVTESFCMNVTKPKPQIRPCQIAPCFASWMIGDWGPCSSCPTGSRKRIVRCVKPTGFGEGESVLVAESECARPKPYQWEACRCPTKKLYTFKEVHTTHCPPPKKKQKRDMVPVTESPSLAKSTSTNGTQHLNGTTGRNGTADELKPVDMGAVSVDKDSPKEVYLTLHLEANAETFNKSETVSGQKALDLINVIQKEGRGEQI